MFYRLRALSTLTPICVLVINGLFSSAALAVLFEASHSWRIVPDGAFTDLRSAPTGFFDDFPVGSLIEGTSGYDDTASLLVSVCVNPTDSGDCFPIFSGGFVSLSIHGGPPLPTGAPYTQELPNVVGTSLPSLSDLPPDFFQGGPFVVLDDQWIYYAGGPPTPPQGVDYAGLSYAHGLSTGAGFVGRLETYNTVWLVHYVTLINELPANTFADDFGLSDIDLYSRGDPVLSLYVCDEYATIGGGPPSCGNVYAMVPEPGAALLVSLGLAGLAARRRTVAAAPSRCQRPAAC